jgi:hypothetical protein
MTQYVSFGTKILSKFKATFNLVEKSRRGILKKVREEVKPTTMGHGYKRVI